MMQRDVYKKGILEANREQKLNDIGVSWYYVNDRWEDMYNLLVQFKEREGHLNVPYRHKEDGENLGYWLAFQRQLEKKEVLQADRRAKLDVLGVVWRRKQTA